MKLLILCLFIAGVSASSLSAFSKNISDANSFDGNIWAVLVAGSKGWTNYRHQADVCHAYQILKSHGVPDERIVVMMYDDIANNPENPTPGKIINRPDGPNVYAGVPKDYVGEDVTPSNFLKVLEGDEELKKDGYKVLGSTDKDHVFVFFSDHGAPGLVAFPSEMLYAKDFIATLEKMHSANRYNRMVIYIEACEAGSMFDGLLKTDHRIYGVSAANPDEPSWGYYCDSGNCLGDEFSVKWMEDSDKTGDLRTETLDQQFARVKDAVKKSHVTHYGDLSFVQTQVGEYQGEKADVSQEIETKKHLSVVSYDIPIFEAEMRVKKTNSELEVKKLDAMRKGREFVDTVKEHLAAELEKRNDLPHPLLGWQGHLDRHGCYKALVQAFNDHCFDLSQHSYALRSMYLLVNTCRVLPDESEKHVAPIYETIATFCQQNVQDHPFRAIV